MAVENLFAPNLRLRWILAAAFGLVHGFGFSFGLANEMQFAGSHLLLSLLAFNVGIEIGQLLAIALVWPLLAWAVTRYAQAERVMLGVLSGFVAHEAWHWLNERFVALGRADWQGLLPLLWPQGASLLLLLVAAWMGVAAWRRRTPVLAARGDPAS
jgi:hypothetical protein